ncbi:conserved hypothetical protein [Theileria orientalis strain Shintoku]|uniref:Uncharacterized protein n=1 Tax=Theileria orientalis strain Shintoku TaxID=869250 RepID=J4D6G1_THEOR|nr:conserved hypothetical protein [Theileria orientalis strain Shintoku]BAM39555.1 conserved hypothetical protein [Theileria orientalis strain Shintoku]|eukprot:XP_009689856.1 conserved hypothetical protein [Theileria orientalis strain Shintoku]
MEKCMCILYVCISSLFTNIARVSSLAHNPSGLGALVVGSATYHETPLHNLDDVADLGVESSGTRKDRLHELEEILEDESQSPDEQSASRYEENVKVFDNPAVLEATSHPTEDEVKDFQKVSQHELATRDDHFDALNTLISEPKLLDFAGADNAWNPGGGSGPRGLNGKPGSATGNPLGVPLPNPFSDQSQRGILGKFPPLSVNARTRNHFHVLNVHHHYPQPQDSPRYPEGVKFAQGFLTKECFEGGFDGQPGSQSCYCSRSETCRCTKTYMMLLSMCDTLVNDPYVKQFCGHHGVKRDHPKLNHRFARSQDNSVSDAFNAVHGAMCNYKGFGHCR